MSTLNAYIKAKSKDKLTKVRFRYRSGVVIDLDYTSDILICPQFWDSRKQILKKSSKFPIEEIIKLNSLIAERKNIILDIILTTKNSKRLNSTYLNKQILLKLNNNEEPAKKQVFDFFQLFDLSKWNNIMSCFISSYNMTSPPAVSQSRDSYRERQIELRVNQVSFRIIGYYILPTTYMH